MKSEKFISIWASSGLILTAIIWGLAFVVVKDSLDWIPPIYMLAFRFTIATLSLSLIFAVRLKNIDIITLRYGFILGVLLFSSYAAQTIGCKYTTAGKNAFLTAVYVVIVPFLHWIINRQRTNKVHILSAIITIVGIGLISLRGDFTIGSGDLLTLICGLGFATHMVFIKRYTAKSDPVLLTVLQLFFAAILSWLVAPVTEGGFPSGVLKPQMAGSMLYLGLLSTMLAFFLQNLCQKYTSPSTAAVLLSTEAVFGVLFSALLLGEQLTPRMTVGCILILFAILTAEMRTKRSDEFRNN